MDPAADRLGRHGAAEHPSSPTRLAWLGALHYYALHARVGHGGHTSFVSSRILLSPPSTPCWMLLTPHCAREHSCDQRALTNALCTDLQTLGIPWKHPPVVKLSFEEWLKVGSSFSDMNRELQSSLGSGRNFELRRSHLTIHEAMASSLGVFIMSTRFIDVCAQLEPNVPSSPILPFRRTPATPMCRTSRTASSSWKIRTPSPSLSRTTLCTTHQCASSTPAGR